MLAMLGAWRAAAMAGLIAFFLGYHALLRVPHFLATLDLVVLDPAWRAFAARHPLALVLAPAALLIAWTSARLLLPYAHPAQRWLSVVSLVWGLQHIAAQNFGILRIYQGRAGRSAERLLRILEREAIRLLLVASVCDGLRRQRVLPEGLAGPAASVCLAAFAVLFLAWTGAMLRRPGPLRGLLPAMAYFASAAVVMIRWPFYDTLGPANLGNLEYFYAFNGHHCLAYLGLVHLVRSNRLGAGDDAGYHAEARRWPVWMAVLVAASVALLALGAQVAVGGMPDSPRAVRKVLLALEGVFIVHYYLEAVVWRLGTAHGRAHLLPLLRRPPQPLPASVRRVMRSPIAPGGA